MIASSQRVIIILLFIIIISCLYFSVINLIQDPSTILLRLPSAKRNGNTDLKHMAIGDLPSPSTYAEISQRPPFSRSRRPPEPELPTPQVPDVTQAEAEPPPTLTLVGIAIDSQRQVALFRKPSDGMLIRVLKGEFVNNWQLVDIGLRQVIFQSGSEEYVIPLISQQR